MSNKHDQRLQQGAPDSRGSREDLANVQRPENDGARSAEDYRQLLRNEFTQEALPSVPPLPGWHLCWLSTTSSHDPIHKRMRLGYVPVKISEIRGGEELTGYKIKSGELEGCIACHEMVLFKLPLEKYQMLMAEFHHNMPQAEEESIYAKVQSAKAAAGARGRRLVDDVGDGFTSLRGDDDADEPAAPGRQAPVF